MKRRKTSTLAAAVFILTGVIVGTLIKPSYSNPRTSAPIGDDLSSHYTELDFELAPNESKAFDLPRRDFPVQVNIGTSNVTASYRGKNIQVGPMVLGVVASYSAAGIANMTGRGSQNWVAEDTPATNSYYNIGQYGSLRNLTIVGRTAPAWVCLSLSINRHTGQMTVSTSDSPKASLSPTSRISYQVSMYY